MSGDSGSLSLLPKRLQHRARRSTVLKVPDPPPRCAPSLRDPNYPARLIVLDATT